MLTTAGSSVTGNHGVILEGVSVLRFLRDQAAENSLVNHALPQDAYNVFLRSSQKWQHVAFVLVCSGLLRCD
jgi:hypothetical protein